MRLFEEYRYFFYITNDRKMTTAKEVVFSANDRCDQENLIAQLKNGVHAPTGACGRPGEQLGVYGDGVAGLEPEGLELPFLVPVSPRHQARNMNQRNEELLRMEFTTYCAAFIQMPCQIVRAGRRLIYRLLSWNPWQGVFLRLVERLHAACWLC